MVHRALIIYGLGFGTGVVLTIMVAVSVAGGKPPTAYPQPVRVITVVSVVTPTPPRIILTPVRIPTLETPPTPALSGGSASQGTVSPSNTVVTSGVSGSLATFTPIPRSPTTTLLPTPDITPKTLPQEGGPTTTEVLLGPADEDSSTPVWTCGSPTPVGFPFRLTAPGC